MRVVVDSGIWISAFQFGGAPLDAIFKVLQQDEIVFCAPIQHEVETVLAKKFGWRAADVLDILDEFVHTASRVKIRGAVTEVCRDPKDDMLFECALAGYAEVILSGDKDVLVVKRFRGVCVLSVRDYLDRKGR